MQVLMLKGLSLCPLTIRHFIAGLHPSLPLYLSLSILPVSVCQVLFAGFSTQERRLCLRENLPFISRDKKMKRGFGTLYLSPIFVFILYASFLSAPLCCVFIHPTRASLPSVCPRGETTGRARLAKCTGGWVTGTAEWRMNSLDSHLNPLLI